ncbi:anti-sigma factor domain-containing protein [Streptomyces sp. NPDC020681]|uniref:anti-sigma factor n=1 Tax=Streptomyces sp. NPDC020681 TaxID=3365083 RepID=UPI00378F2134
MNAPDLHAAVGAYVLHALEENERRAFEQHLADCEACRQEVDELNATAARLGRAVAIGAPAELKDQVMRRVAATGQERPLPVRDRFGPPARWLPRLALAACLAAAVAFGGIAIWQHEEAETARSAVRQAEQREAAAADVLSAPDAVYQTQELAGGGLATVAVSRNEDAAAFIATGLPELPAGKVYELWFAEAGTMRPAGLLSGTASRQLTLLDGPVGGATGVGVTVEPAGGSAQPTTAPLGLISFT